MEKKFYNEHTGISYTLQGDYYLPDLTLPAEKEKPIGICDISDSIRDCSILTC